MIDNHPRVAVEAVNAMFPVRPNGVYEVRNTAVRLDGDGKVTVIYYVLSGPE